MVGWVGDRQLQMTTAGVPPSFFIIWRCLVGIGGGVELMVEEAGGQPALKHAAAVGRCLRDPHMR